MSQNDICGGFIIMLWGSFGAVHIISLILAVGMNVAVYFILKNKSVKTQLITLGIYSLWGIAAVVFDMFMWNSPIEYLPLHLCSISAVVLPFAVFTRSKIINNLLLLWSLGAVAALVVNTQQANFEIFSGTFLFYYMPHVVELGIPVIMFKLGLVKKDARCIFSTLGITFVAYTIIHFINLGLNALIVANNMLDWKGDLIQVNYMYSLSSPGNPVLDLLYNILPHSYWYMLLLFPIMLIYLCFVYLPEIIRMFKAKRTKEQ